MIKKRLGTNPLPLVIPIGSGEMFTGIIDLIEMKSILYNESTMGSRFEYGEIPDDMNAEAEKWRHHLIEETATYDEHLMEKYLNDEDISSEEIKNAIRKGCLTIHLFPMFCGSAFKNKGVQRLLDAIVDFCHHPKILVQLVVSTKDSDGVLVREPSNDEPFSALAFKIMTDPYVGKLTYMRVYSGSLNAGSYVYNPSSGKRERISRILLMHSNKRERETLYLRGKL